MLEAKTKKKLRNSMEMYVFQNKTVHHKRKATYARRLPSPEKNEKARHREISLVTRLS